MNLQMSRLALGSIVALILAGCASTAVHEQALREPAASEGIVIGSLLVRGGRDVLGRTEWGLSIDRAETKFAQSPYSIRAHQGREEVAFAVAVPSGRYRIHQLFQGGLSNFARNTDFSFEVQPGKTSYIGRLIVEFPEETITVFTQVRIRVEDARDANIAAAEVKYRRTFADVDTRLVVAGSTGSTLPVPPPPSSALPISAFAVKFTPAGTVTYSPTGATGIKTYRVVSHLSDGPPKVQRDEKPTRAYLVIGKLQLGKNWYTGANIVELEEKHVPQVRGDAVLTWTVHQTATAVLPGVGTLIYAAYEAEVIRYTDK